MPDIIQVDQLSAILWYIKIIVDEDGKPTNLNESFVMVFSVCNF